MGEKIHSIHFDLYCDNSYIKIRLCPLLASPLSFDETVPVLMLDVDRREVGSDVATASFFLKLVPLPRYMLILSVL